MTDPHVEWSIPRFGMSIPTTRMELTVDYGISALLLLSGLTMGNGARLLLGLAMIAMNLVGTDAFGIRSAIPSLNGEKRPLTGGEWLAVAAGVVLLVGAVINDFAGFLFLMVASMVTWVLVHDSGGVRSALPLLGSKDKNEVFVGWAGLGIAGLVVLTVITPGQGGRGDAATVLRVIDGDTILVQKGGQQDTVRVIGIDTPESVPPRPPACYGREASAQAHRLLNGAGIKLESDGSQAARDQYGRLLAHVWLPDGRLYGGAMIADGYAFEYTYGKPYAYQREYRDAQARARSERRGLWGACAT